MGIIKKMHLAQKNEKQQLQKELQNRADQFMKEYRTIRARYQCDFQAYLKLLEGGEAGITPGLRIVDITKTIEAEEKAERKKEEAIKPVKPNKIPGNDINTGKF